MRMRVLLVFRNSPCQFCRVKHHLNILLEPWSVKDRALLALRRWQGVEVHTVGWGNAHCPGVGRTLCFFISCLVLKGPFYLCFMLQVFQQDRTKTWLVWAVKTYAPLGFPRKLLLFQRHLYTTW